MSGQDFSWYSKEDEDSIVIKAVTAVAVYTNPNRDIVIRQQNTLGDEDHVVVFPVAQANTIIKAIKAAVAELKNAD